MSDQINIEQIKAAMEGNVDLQTQIVNLSMQTEAGKSVLNNHLKTSFNREEIEKAAANAATNKAYGNIDAMLEKHGIEVEPGAKTSEKYEQPLKELAALKKSKDATQAEKEDAQKTIQAIKSQANKEVEDLKQINSNLQTKLLQNSIRSDISTSKSKIFSKANPAIPTNVAESYWNVAESELIAFAEEKDGKIIYKDKDGTPYLSANRDYATAEEIMMQKMKDVMLDSNAGGGAEQNKNSAGTIENGSAVINMTNVKTQSQFLENCKSVAIAQGIAFGSKEWYPFYREAMNKYNVFNLPTS